MVFQLECDEPTRLLDAATFADLPADVAAVFRPLRDYLAPFHVAVFGNRQAGYDRWIPHVARLAGVRDSVKLRSPCSLPSSVLYTVCCIPTYLGVILEG